MQIKENWITYIHDLQDRICAAVEDIDTKGVFREDKWTRPAGGGGKTRILNNGTVFEKGGVNTSVVFGDVTEGMKIQLKMKGHKWFACGLSLVLHPFNPFVPTVHCNYRMLEIYDESGETLDRWFGGGADLTPFYLFNEDATHFHKSYKRICDQYDLEFYPEFKKECDQYFVNRHRNNETRGIGGIFFDYRRATPGKDENFWMSFAKSCGDGFAESYLPIVLKRMNTTFTDANRFWQEIRRGRYTEFNLVHDRGTIFGLKTDGRTESILMSLPPTVRFEYDYQPLPGSEEDKLWQACLHPKEWV